MTYKVSADYAHQNFDKIIQQAQQEPEGVVITQGDKKFVLIEQSKLKEIKEAEQFEQLPNLFKNIVPLREQYHPGRTINLDDFS